MENSSSADERPSDHAAARFAQLYRHRRTFLTVNGAVIAVAVTVLLVFVKNDYDSTIVILPNYGGTSMLGGLGSLAAVAGLNIGESNPAAVYQKLIVSESVLEEAIYRKYSTAEFADSVDLIAYFEIELEKTGPSDPPFLQERDKFLQMVEMMRTEMVMTELDRITNILTITVRTPEPRLSSAVANTLIESLDRYVRTKRRSNAVDQRIYIEERTTQVKDSLDGAEEELRRFREQNRIVTSPQLLLEQSRLLRSVEIQQAVYIELTRQMELVKLEEIKDSPIINVQEAAGVPVKKSGPSRLKYLLAVLVFSVSVTAAYYMFRETMTGSVEAFFAAMRSGGRA